MTTESTVAASPVANDVWRQIDLLVEGIAKLAKQDIAPGKFYAEVLERIVPALSAVGGSIWTRGGEGELGLECRVAAENAWLNGADPSVPSHAEVMAAVLRGVKSRAIVPNQQPTPGEQVWNPTGLLLIAAPWTVDGLPLGVLEIVQRPGASPEMQRGYVTFAEAICELVGDYCRNRLFRDFRLRSEDWTRFTAFSRQVHKSLDLKATAYAIANDGRTLLGCDRVAVLVRRGRQRYKILAVSGVESFQRRANVVRRMEMLAARVARTGEPLWYPDKKDDLPPQVEESLGDYLDESHSRWLAMLPLRRVADGKAADRREPLGMLVVERFKGTLDERQRMLLPAMCEQSAAALGNALELQAIPLAGLLRASGRLLRAGPLLTIALIVGMIAAAVAALVYIPADFNLEARGELQPRRTADVFALADGVISKLHAEHGQHVRAGDILAELRRPQLDFEFKQVWGELQIAQKRLANTESQIIQLRGDSEEDRRSHSKLVAQQEELGESIKSLKEQYAILEKKQSELEVRSPIEGDVLTWDVKQLLQDRPVDRGQALLTVGDLNGPWKLELRIPDREIAHVLAARRTDGDDLSVSYRMASRPGMSLQGTLEQVGLRAESAEGDEPYVLATVNIDRASVPELIPGATVKALIHCGRRPVGYVWFHDMVDSLRAWFNW